MSKKLNEATIMNELKEGSIFFQQQPKNNPEHANGRTPERETVRTDERANVGTPEHPKNRSSEQVNTRTPERKIVRHSFNFYKDQITELRKLVAHRTLEDKETTLSDIMREVLDTYLANTRTEVPTNRRTSERKAYGKH